MFCIWSSTGVTGFSHLLFHSFFQKINRLVFFFLFFFLHKGLKAGIGFHVSLFACLFIFPKHTYDRMSYIIAASWFYVKSNWKSVGRVANSDQEWLNQS